MPTTDGLTPEMGTEMSPKEATRGPTASVCPSQVRTSCQGSAAPTRSCLLAPHGERHSEHGAHAPRVTAILGAKKMAVFVKSAGCGAVCSSVGGCCGRRTARRWQLMRGTDPTRNNRFRCSCPDITPNGLEIAYQGKSTLTLVSAGHSMIKIDENTF